ncbi:unnamed protein product [Periconia digitata]|uniref:Uncharacterized protein n=1 Tax=Periconia digitata TaxID=1303443 RepID=A0A9W4XR48_9PLEO|nr:unnamed protein product [Periconia digitata]
MADSNQPRIQVVSPVPSHTSFDEESLIESPSLRSPRSHYHFDSAIEISPVSPCSGLIKPELIDSSHFVYPPLITGHGRLVRARQTVPGWIGVLVIVGMLAWVIWCAWSLHPFVHGR